MFKICIALFSLTLSTLSYSANYLLEIHNQTQRPLHYVYVSNSQDETWEEDLLSENEFLQHDGQISLTLTDYENPYFDVRAIDDHGDLYYRYRVAVEQKSVLFSPQDRVKNTHPEKKINNLK